MRAGDKGHGVNCEETAKRPGWIARHFSFKRKKGSGKGRAANAATTGSAGYNSSVPLDIAPLESRCSSSPQLEWAGRGAVSNADEAGVDCASPTARRPSCVDRTALPLNLDRYLDRDSNHVNGSSSAYVSPRQLAGSPHDHQNTCFRYPTPPRILETDYDLDKLTAIGVGWACRLYTRTHTRARAHTHASITY